MKCSLKWLREYVDIALPVADLADRLTMAGLEVKGMQIVGSDWENIVIGQIIAVDPHPDADRLRLATIDLGIEQMSVVTGAPDLRSGDKVAFARVGAQLIDGNTGRRLRLKSAKIRGVVSNGMACSEKELGISDSHGGIMVLPAEAPVGTTLADYLGDAILDLDVTPNRPDCLSVLGVAREIAVLTGQNLHIPDAGYDEAGTSIDRQISVEIAAPDLCPRYCASLITGAKVASSPQWIQQRLLACGMRPINNIVDITNYVMLEYGQPLHAFEYDQIRGRKIIVRRAAEGEHLVTLDGVERVLHEDMLVIADEERSVALAGVMGGANSEVNDRTTSILMEAANFNPANIHHTGSALFLSSEAHLRFERGIRPELALLAIKRATQLTVEIAGGEAAKGIADAYPGRLDRKPIRLSTAEAKRLLGVEFSPDQIADALDSLGFDCDKQTSEVWATPPYWRSDIHLAVDLIEEVIRIIGYDKIPMTMLDQPIPRHNPAPIINFKQEVKRNLTGYGFQEIITYSLTGLEMLSKLAPGPHPFEPEPLRVTNPMTADQEYLRPNLRANLLVVFAANRRHEDDGMRLFELGKVYLPRPKELPDEREMLCGVLSGHRLNKSWRDSNELVDFFDAKGIVEKLLSQVGVNARFEKNEDESLHPNKQASVFADCTKVGVIGELHPKVSQSFEISETIYLFEIDVTALLPFTVGHKRFQPIPRFPAVIRDMALVVDTGVAHQQIQDIIESFPLVNQANVFDVYSGAQVPSGKKSLAYRVDFLSPDHTLTDDEVDGIYQQILKKLSRELGTTLRA